MELSGPRRFLSALLIVCGAATASPAAAQSMLGGAVREPSGLVARNINVVAENEATGETWETRDFLDAFVRKFPDVSVYQRQASKLLP